MATRHLPVLTEVSLSEVKAARIQIAQDYDLQVRSRVSSLTCRPNCNNCCNHPTYISLLEGTLTYRALVKQGKWPTYKPKLQEASKRTRGLAIEIWAMSDIPCPLLENGLCSIYEARPLSCRIAYSIGPAENCKPNRFDGGFLPKAAMIDLFSRSETSILERHKAKLFRLPLATATLWGELIDKGELGLEDSLEALLKDPSNG